MSKSLQPDQDQCFVHPDPGLNCLHIDYDTAHKERVNY